MEPTIAAATRTAASNAQRPPTTNHFQTYCGGELAVPAQLAPQRPSPDEQRRQAPRLASHK
eukprot:4476736-Lingulodinium_polyedra.AAC.1